MFSTNVLDLHDKLKQAAPDKKKALFEAFLFNNWASYHLITREICASMPASATAIEVKAARDNIAKLLINAAQNEAAPILKTKFGINIMNYCGGSFFSYAEETFVEYESSVARHQAPACLSAAIRLGVCADLPMPDFSNLEQSMAAQMEIKKESAQIFLALEELIRDDVQDYLRTK